MIKTSLRNQVLAASKRVADDLTRLITQLTLPSLASTLMVRSLRGTLPLGGPDDEVIGVTGVGQDITQICEITKEQNV